MSRFGIKQTLMISLLFGQACQHQYPTQMRAQPLRPKNNSHNQSSFSNRLFVPKYSNKSTSGSPINCLVSDRWIVLYHQLASLQSRSLISLTPQDLAATPASGVDYHVGMCSQMFTLQPGLIGQVRHQHTSVICGLNSQTLDCVGMGFDCINQLNYTDPCENHAKVAIHILIVCLFLNILVNF